MAAKRIAALIHWEPGRIGHLERALSLELLGADELVLWTPGFDEGLFRETTARLARDSGLPLSVGCVGLDLDRIALLLEAGADRVFLDLHRDGALLEPAAARFGRAVLGVRSAGLDLESLRECCERGAGEILLEPGPTLDSGFLLALAALPVPVMVRCADGASAELALQCGADAVALDPMPEGAHAVKALKASLAAQGLLLRD